MNFPNFPDFFNRLCIHQFNCSGILEPRSVILHRAKRGFGFVLRGAKAASPLMQLKPSDRCPGLQYLDDVDPGGVADMAGLFPGDFLLAVSGLFVNSIKTFFFFCDPRDNFRLIFADKWRRCAMRFTRTCC